MRDKTHTINEQAVMGLVANSSQTKLFSTKKKSVKLLVSTIFQRFITCTNFYNRSIGITKPLIHKA